MKFTPKPYSFNNINGQHWNRRGVFSLVSRFPWAQIGFRIAGGGYFDPVGKEGLAHLTEHLMLPHEQMMALTGTAEMHGGSFMPGAVSSLYRFVGINLPLTDGGVMMSEYLKLIKRAIFSPKITPEQVEEEKKTLVQEILMKEGVSTRQKEFFRSLLSNLFGVNSKFAIPGYVGGSPESLEKITLEDVYEYIDLWTSSPNFFGVYSQGEVMQSGIVSLLESSGWGELVFSSNVSPQMPHAWSWEDIPEVSKEPFRFSMDEKDSSNPGSRITWQFLLPGTMSGVEISLFSSTLNRYLTLLLRETDKYVYGLTVSPEFRDGVWVISIDTTTQTDLESRVIQIFSEAIASLPQYCEFLNDLRISIVAQKKMASRLCYEPFFPWFQSQGTLMEYLSPEQEGQIADSFNQQNLKDIVDRLGRNYQTIIIS